jgi:hypothetical protein
MTPIVSPSIPCELTTIGLKILVETEIIPIFRPNSPLVKHNIHVDDSNIANNTSSEEEEMTVEDKLELRRLFFNLFSYYTHRDLRPFSMILLNLFSEKVGPQIK